MSKSKQSTEKKILILVILFLAAFLRFYNLNELTTFSGEEGKDFLIVKKIITDKDFTLLGPKIGPYNNISQIYLGPAYYYLILPALFIFRLDPIGPSVLMALLSTIVTLLVFKIGQSFFNTFVGLSSAALFATSPILVELGRSSNPAYFIPIFSALLLYSYKKVFIDKKSHYLILTGTSLAFLIQFHYTTIIAFAGTIIWFATLKQKIGYKNYIFGLVGFFLFISPVILFELRNEFFITKSIYAQINHRENYVASFSFAGALIDSSQKLIESLITQKSKALFYIVAAATLLSLKQLFLSRNKYSINKKYVVLFLAWVIINLVTIFFYSGPFVYHYFASSFIPLLLIVSLSFYVLDRYFKIGTVILIIVVTLNLVSNDITRNHGYTMPDGWNLVGVKHASAIIARDAENAQSFNIAATLDGDTRAMPYRYLVEVFGEKPKDVESYPDSDVIYLISRDDQTKVKNYTVWEVSSFAPFEIIKLADIQNDIKLYKLTKTL